MGTKKINVLIGFIVLLAIACLVFLYYQISEAGDMWPAYQEPGTLTNAINGLERDITRLIAEEKKIPAARETLVAVTADYELAARVLPRESSPDQLIAAIRTKAQQAGVYPSALQPSVVRGGASRGAKAKKSGGDFETWRFTLALDGTYDQIATFVNRMEEFDSSDASRVGSEKRFFEVRQIDVSSMGDGMAGLEPATAGEPVRHKCTMVMQTYRYTGE